MPKQVVTDNKGIVTIDMLREFLRRSKRIYMNVRIDDVITRLYLIHTGKDEFIQLSNHLTRAK